jgi:ketopantoate reductase
LTLSEAVIVLINEVIEIGNTDLQARREDRQIDKIQMKNRTFNLTKTMGAYQPSSMVDFINEREMEINATFTEPIRRAKELGIQTSRMLSISSSMDELQTNTEMSYCGNLNAR